MSLEASLVYTKSSGPELHIETISQKVSSSVGTSNSRTQPPFLSSLPTLTLKALSLKSNNTKDLPRTRVWPDWDWWDGPVGMEARWLNSVLGTDLVEGESLLPQLFSNPHPANTQKQTLNK